MLFARYFSSFVSPLCTLAMECRCRECRPGRHASITQVRGHTALPGSLRASQPGAVWLVTETASPSLPKTG
ncbi:uncharacterized protein B0I36DRAFT_83195 [Microdochium trichocladiopsis]|uniref:Secreted protein n=1 Tax=Microdochium trichocladiopsis TaxID=1682393 RepID=A0A9P9BSE6_9PEZI|nr:uncharacterized protein B0I36DRAFT_83195 [Microdochium trichocladiopsis]KAH7034695.1 hypothetical protein B0I36DRAFT_83195 [Microdochium trichocladiopsis]